MPHSIIAIDGPAASGKSSVARLLAQKLGFLFVSSGHFFRTIAWKAHHDQLDISDNTKVDDWLATFSLQSQIIAGEIHLLINGIDLTEYQQDSARAIAPLLIAPGAIVIDTTHLSIEEVVEEILRHVNALLYNNEAVRSS